MVVLRAKLLEERERLGPRLDALHGPVRHVGRRLALAVDDLGVELIEQPFPARAYRDLGWLQERSSIPIVAEPSPTTVKPAHRNGWDVSADRATSSWAKRSAVATGSPAARRW